SVMLENETRYRRDVREWERYQGKARQRLVARNRNHEWVVRVTRRLPERRAVDLDLGMRMEFKALDKQQVNRGHPRHQFVEGRFGVAAQFVLQSPTAPRSDHDLARACVAVAPRILARLIEIEGMMRMLNRRNRDPASDEFRYHCRHQRRLAA